MNGFCHGDDFVTVAAEDQGTGSVAQVCQSDQRRIHGGSMQIRDMFLNFWRILDLLGATLSRPPRVKLSAIEADAIENSPIFEGEQATLFLSGTMR